MNNTLVKILRVLLPYRFFGPFWYRKFYLRSKHWRHVRRKKLESVKYKCNACGKVKSFTVLMNVHHLNYDRLFSERMKDLEVLCVKDHERKHK